MNVWYAIPSCNPQRARKCFDAWRTMGYKTFVFVDQEDIRSYGADESMSAPYAGYWDASNLMAKICVNDLGADYVVFGGDDLYCDPNKTAEEIGDQLSCSPWTTFQVMQPTGDRLGLDANGVPAAARICGSPWLGAEWVRRAYGGKGPAWPGYHSFFSDEELKLVAEKLGVLWQRPDLCQLHEHWSRPGAEPRTEYQIENNNAYWKIDRALFEQRKAEGFPGSDLLPK